MSTNGRRNPLPWLVLILALAVYAGWAAFPASGLYRSVLDPHRLLVLASTLKLVYLLAAAAWAFQCRDRLEADNPARPAWFLLSLGLLSTFAGQLCLAPHQLARNETPFPSVADIFYVLSYPLLIAALLALLKAYREAGLPFGSLAERAAILAVVGVIAAIVAVPILRPVAVAGGPLLDRILTVAYPILDLILLLPLALLLRVALRLRGSHAGEVWLLLLVGFVFLCAGDISFAYFQSLGMQHLDPFVHATYILSYGLIAGGAHRQLELLKP
jgi:cytochrome bd-type quinol oxidase subunit 2